MTLSVIIPLFNEEKVVLEFYKRTLSVLKKDFKKFNYELIFVDDGSLDNTFEILKKIRKTNSKIKVIQFSRNFGHHIAIMAGLDEAKGDLIVVMDGDLQERPEDIVKIYKKLNQGYDLVYGVKKNRKDNLFRKSTAYLFWYLIKKLSGLNISPNQTMLRIFNRKVLLAVRQFNESNRFYAAIFNWVGFKQGSVEIIIDKRYAGKSKYSVAKMVGLSLTAILGFSNIPLYYISYLGILISATSFLIGLFYIIRKLFFNLGVVGWPTIVIMLSFIGGMIILSIGVVGIYLSKIHTEILKRPHYIINKKLA